jgi:hypothetical protein
MSDEDLESVDIDLRRLRNDLTRFVGAFEPDAYSGGLARELVELFSEIERTANAGKLLCARRVEATRAHVTEGHKRAGTWLASVTGEPEGQAVAELEAARAIESDPDIREALTEGRLSGAQVIQIASVLDRAPAEAKELARQAPGLEFSELKRRVREARLMASSADEEVSRHERIRRGRYLRMWTDPEGAAHLEARMTPEALGIVKSSLEQEAKGIFDEARKDGRRESHGAYMADALVALAAGGRELEGPGRAVRMRPLVRIRVDLSALYRGQVQAGETCEIPGIDSPLPVSLARELIGESVLELIVTEGVEVRTVVTESRHISRSIRIALEERDRTCCVPGCRATDPLEADHWQTDYAEIKRTALDNLALICPYHHDQKTHRGWRLEGPPGRWRFVGPDGQEAREPGSGPPGGSGPPQLFVRTDP